MVLRCFGIGPFALENYPTQCMYRRGLIVIREGKGVPSCLKLLVENGNENPPILFSLTKNRS